MTIELKLDTKALSSLLEQDGEFKLKLQQCILENIARRHVKGVDSILSAAIEKAAAEKEAEILKEFGSFKIEKSGSYPYYNNKHFSLSPDLIAEIKAKISEFIQDEISSFIEKEIEKRLEAAKAKITSQIFLAMDSHTKTTIATMIKEKFEEAMKQIKGE